MVSKTGSQFILSPIIFNNESGVLKTFESKRRKYKISRDCQIDSSEVDCSERFDDIHVKKYRSLYDDKLIKKIRDGFEQALDKGMYVEKTHNKNVVSKHIFSYDNDSYDGCESYDFSQNIPEINDLLLGETKKIIESYYNSHFEPDFIKFSRKLPISNELAKKTGINSTSWHLDRGQPDYMKLFINLNSLTQVNGPTQILKRPDTENHIRPSMSPTVYYDGELAEKMGNDRLDDKIIMADGEAGTATFANTHLCLHRAGITKEGVRDIITIQLKPSNKELPKDWLHNDLNLSPTH